MFQEGDVFVPSNVESITGDCSNGDKSIMLLKWKSFELSFVFAKVSLHFVIIIF